MRELVPRERQPRLALPRTQRAIPSWLAPVSTKASSGTTRCDAAASEPAGRRDRSRVDVRRACSGRAPPPTRRRAPPTATPRSSGRVGEFGVGVRSRCSRDASEATRIPRDEALHLAQPNRAGTAAAPSCPQRPLLVRERVAEPRRRARRVVAAARAGQSRGRQTRVEVELVEEGLVLADRGRTGPSQAAQRRRASAIAVVGAARSRSRSAPARHAARARLAAAPTDRSARLKQRAPWPDPGVSSSAPASTIVAVGMERWSEAFARAVHASSARSSSIERDVRRPRDRADRAVRLGADEAVRFRRQR